MVVLEGAFLVSPALTDWTTGQRPSQARAPSTAVTHERVDPPRSWDDLEVFEDYLRGPEVAHRSPRTQSGRSREASAQKARLIATAVAVVLN